MQDMGLEKYPVRVEMDVDKDYLQAAILDEKKNIPNYMKWLQ
ncbi:MAG: hypothetical protein WBZ36_24210 [Candidatus Nitrosopolaris sp.]